MSGVLGYALGYDAGRSDAEVSRQRREIVDRVFYGQRPVQVDQSYLDQLHRTREQFRRNSIHNFDKGEQFYAEALDWKGKAEQFHGEALHWRGRALASGGGCESSPGPAQLAERDAALAQAQAACAAERAAHQTTHEEKWGLNLFRLMATWLINAHIAGRSDRPEFAELRDMAKDVTDAIERGEPFRGYRDEPEKKARLDRRCWPRSIVPEIPRGLRADRPHDGLRSQGARS